jgi:hypothetical protein
MIMGEDNRINGSKSLRFNGQNFAEALTADKGKWRRLIGKNGIKQYSFAFYVQQNGRMTEPGNICFLPTMKSGNICRNYRKHPVWFCYGAAFE